MTFRRPSILELVACERLKHSLLEGLRYLLENIKQVDQLSKSKFISKYKDETVLLIDSIIEYSYLKTQNASYVENLFNLIRQSGDARNLQGRILPSLLSLTLMPYIRQKIDTYFEQLNYKETLTYDESRRIQLYRLLKKFLSLIELVLLARYAAGKSTYPNLLSNLLDVRQRVRDSDDETSDDSINPTVLFSLAKLTAGFVGYFLTFGSYTIQFLDHWNTHSNSAPLFSASMPIPDAPKRGKEIPFSDEASSQKCLICSKERQNECALSNTGYVFCYGCIYDYVISRGKCPITGNATSSDNIVKLFSSVTK